MIEPTSILTVISFYLVAKYIAYAAVFAASVLILRAAIND